MTAKQLPGFQAPDGSNYITLTDGAGNLVTPGGGGGSVSSVSVVTANGVSGSVATPTTTPAITLTLGDITPTSVNATNAGSATNPTLTVGNATTGLHSVGTTGIAIDINGGTGLDFGISTGNAWTTNSVFRLGNAGTALTLSNNTAGIGLRNGSTLVTSPATATWQLGAADAAAPVAQTLQAQSVVAGNANTAGATTTISGSKSNGTGGGDVVFKTTLSNAASGTQNTLATSLTLKGGTQEVVCSAPLKLQGYTVATLPAGNTGDTAYVTDALAPTFLAAVSGGGAVITPVFYNGTSWVGG